MAQPHPFRLWLELPIGWIEDYLRRQSSMSVLDGLDNAN